MTNPHSPGRPISIRGDFPTPLTSSTSRRRSGLPVRFVTRMSDSLNEAVAAAAREEGVTAGAWVRRLLMERVAVDSARDARSGRPIRKPSDYEVAIGAAIRELGSVNAAIAGGDRDAAIAGIDRARSVLIPLVVRRP